LGLERIFPVYSPLWVEPLPFNTIIPWRTSALAVLKELQNDMRFTQATWYTDGSLLDGRASGAAVIVVSRKVMERILLRLGEGRVAEEGLLERRNGL
jgi:hypothetical protein